MQRFSQDLCQSTKQYTMRYFSLILFCLALSVASCKKTGSNAVIPNGTYSGTFQRLINGGGQISNVTITFSANTWTGQSQSPRYPALCKGAYKEKSADSVSFENNCPWTAEFDWSLILTGDYKIVTSGENLEMSHNYSNGYLDVYKLKRH